MPQAPAGLRIEPPVSVPRRERHHAGRDAGARPGRRAAGHVIAVPRIARRRIRQVESGSAVSELVQRELAEQDRAGAAQPASPPPHRAFATCFAMIFEWQVVRSPATSMMSFSATGTPCSGPRMRPARISLSACRASSSARSAPTSMKAFSFGSCFSMRARSDCDELDGRELACR